MKSCANRLNGQCPTTKLQLTSILSGHCYSAFLSVNSSIEVIYSCIIPRHTGFGRFVAAQERNAFVAVGDDVRLNCSTTNMTLPVKWERKFFKPTSHRIEELLYISIKNRTFYEKMSVSPVQSVNKQHHDLVINRTSSSDAGSYNCVQSFRSLASHRLVLVGRSCRNNVCRGLKCSRHRAFIISLII